MCVCEVDNQINIAYCLSNISIQNYQNRLTYVGVISCQVGVICLRHTHTHPFNGPLPGTTQVSRYQKGKTDLDFTEARDSEWQWHQLGHMQICTSLQTDNHTSTPPLSFLQTGSPSYHPTNNVKALKEHCLFETQCTHITILNFYCLNALSDAELKVSKHTKIRVGGRDIGTRLSEINQKLIPGTS